MFSAIVMNKDICEILNLVKLSACKQFVKISVNEECLLFSIYSDYTKLGLTVVHACVCVKKFWKPRWQPRYGYDSINDKNCNSGKFWADS